MKPDFVFVVGVNRTGTSLLREILNHSPQMCLAPETHFLKRLARRDGAAMRPRFGDLLSAHNVKKLVAYLYAEHRAFKVSYWQWLKRQVPRQDFMQGVLATNRSPRAVFEMLMRLYAEHAAQHPSPELILGEKTPVHLYAVPTLLEWFPHARILHTIRDPRAIIVSKLTKVNRTTSRDGLFKRLGYAPQILTPVTDPVEILYTSRQWMDAARLHQDYARRYPQQYMLVRFEDLVGDPQNELARVFSFLDIEFDPRVLNEIQVVASSFDRQHRGASGMDRRTLERWKEQSHPLVERGFALWGRAQLEQFGYTP